MTQVPKASSSCRFFCFVFFFKLSFGSGQAALLGKKGRANIKIGADYKIKAFSFFQNHFAKKKIQKCKCHYKNAVSQFAWHFLDFSIGSPVSWEPLQFCLASLIISNMTEQHMCPLGEP